MSAKILNYQAYKDMSIRRDTRKIVMVGDPMSGNCTFHGPFDDMSQTLWWVENWAKDQETRVFDLQP